MPIYCFTDSVGKTHERVFRMDEVPEHIILEYDTAFDDIAFRDLAAEWKGSQRSGEKGTWPIECYASGVHASQAQELRDYFKENGCPTEVTSNGDPVYRDHQHRKRALKCRGLHDKASFGT